MSPKRTQRVSVFVSFFFPTLAIAQSYSIDLLAAGNARFRPERFAVSGQIVGRANIGVGLQQAAIWQDGQINVVDDPISWAFDQNAQGVVVGQFGESPSVWTPARQSLGSFGVVRAINGNSEIVGTSWSSLTGGIYPTRWTLSGSDWIAENIGAGGTAGRAFDINENGTIAGATSTSDSPHNPMPALWTNGNLTWLDTQGSTVGVALRVNEQSTCVGWVESPDGYGYSHGFLWQDGISTDLGTFGQDTSSAALAINNLGEAVGWSGEGYGAGDGTSIEQRAMVWSNGAALDLNALIALDLDWHLSIATDINDAGQIVGRGFYRGILNGFILTPVPEPSSFLLALTASGVLILRLRHRRM